MKTNWELKENSQGHLTVEVSGEKWSEAQKKAFDKLAKEIEVDGFRKGSVPEAIAKQKVNQGTVLMDAVDLVAQEALDKGVEAEALELVARPQLTVDKITEDEVVLKFIVTVKPEVKLGLYKGLEAVKEAVTVEDVEVNEELARLQEQSAQLVVKEDAELANGETAVIDFEGFLEGVPFDGGKGENFPLEIGSNQFIPGFEEQLIGMKSGEERDIKVTFPAEYPAPELAGKETLFKVKLHDIKVKELPELDDEFAKELNREAVDSLDDLKKDIIDRMTSEKEQAAEDKYLDAIYNQVVEAAQVDIPVAMIDDEVETMYREFEQRLSQQGLTMEGYLGFLGKSDEEVKADMRSEAEKRVKFRLVISAIAAEEAIEVSEEEIESELKQIAEIYQMELEQVKQLFSDYAGLTEELKARKALKLIQESAK